MPKKNGKSAKNRTRATKTKRASSGAKARSKSRKPKPPMPKQHQAKPGLESKIRPQPRYEAPSYKGSAKLDAKVALITGGDSGIGRAVAVLFAREGADIAITYLPEEKDDAEGTKAAVKAEGSKAKSIGGDATKAELSRDGVKQTIKEIGKLDKTVHKQALHKQQKNPRRNFDKQP